MKFDALPDVYWTVLCKELRSWKYAPAALVLQKLLFGRQFSASASEGLSAEVLAIVICGEQQIMFLSSSADSSKIASRGISAQVPA